MTHDEIYAALDSIEVTRAKLNAVAKYQYESAECPLRGFDHRHMAEMLWGTGCYEWECKFCGVWFSD